MDDPPSPKQKRALTQKDFDRLLAWLDPDCERAGERYEKIRLKLVRRFGRLGCDEPEQRANETIDRVAQTLAHVIATYKGDPEPYFYSVAYYIYLEYLDVVKRRGAGPLPEADLADEGAKMPDDLYGGDGDRDEALDRCLSRCLSQLEEDEREMIMQYYRGERREKIRLRMELAERLGIKLPNLRLRAQRTRTKLKHCILDCLDGNA